MAKTRMALEIGMGTSLRKGDYTRAAVRAVQDALWRNSISFAEAFGFEKSDMLIDIEIGVQKPEAVDSDEVKAVLPYGNGGVRIARGGLDIPKPDGDGVTILANAAIIVSFDMERRTDSQSADSQSADSQSADRQSTDKQSIGTKDGAVSA